MRGVPAGALLGLAVAAAGAASCSLILGIEELPEAKEAKDAGAPDVASVEVDAPEIGPCDCSDGGAWSKAFAASGDVAVAGVVVDSKGAVILAGSVAGSLDIGSHFLPAGGADRDVFVIKLDRCGDPVWSRRFGDAMDQVALAIAVDPREGSGPEADSIVIAGHYAGALHLGDGVKLDATSQRGFVARLAADGSGLAARDTGIDTTGARGTGVAIAADGAVFWTGTEDDETSLFVTKLDPSLALLNRIAPLCASCAPRAAPMPSGDLVIAGGFTGKLDVVPGNAGALTAAGTDAYIAVLTPDDVAPFAFTDPVAARFGDPAPQAVSGLAVGGAGEVFVTGSFAGVVDFGGGADKRISLGGDDVFVARLDEQLGTAWALSFGGALDQRGSAIAVAGDRIAVTGELEGSMDFAPGGAPLPLESKGASDVFVAILDPSGSVLDVAAIGGAGPDRAGGVALDGSLAVVVAGVIAGAADFGCGTLGGPGASIFVTRRPLP